MRLIQKLHLSRTRPNAPFLNCSCFFPYLRIFSFKVLYFITFDSISFMLANKNLLRPFHCFFAEKFKLCTNTLHSETTNEAKRELFGGKSRKNEICFPFEYNGKQMPHPECRKAGIQEAKLKVQLRDEKLNMPSTKYIINACTSNECRLCFFSSFNECGA